MKTNAFLAKLITLLFVVCFFAAETGLSLAIGEDFDPTKEYKVNSQSVMEESSSVQGFNGLGERVQGNSRSRPEIHERESTAVRSVQRNTEVDVFQRSVPFTKPSRESNSPSLFSRFRNSISNTLANVSSRAGSVFSGVRSGMRSMMRSSSHLFRQLSPIHLFQPIQNFVSDEFKAVASLYQSVSHFISSTVTRSTQSVTSIVHLASSSVSNFLSTAFQSIKSDISTQLKAFLLDWKEAIDTFAQDPAHLLTNISFLSLSISPIMAFLVWNPVTGKPLKKLFRTLYEGPISVVDLYLHGICAMVATFDSTFRGYDWGFSYNASKDFMKRTSGRDIGDWKKDALLGGATLTIVATIYFAPVVIAAAEAGTLIPTVVTTAQATTIYVMGESSNALTETSQECTINAINCATPTDAGITFAFNFLPGFMPDFELDQATIQAKDTLLKQGDEITEVGEDVGNVGKVLNNSDDVVKTVVKSPLIHQEVTVISKRIAKGHAFEKHVLNPRTSEEVIEGVETIEQFEELINKAMNNADVIRHRADGTIAFWSEEHKIIVIYNPNMLSDLGTAFKQTNGLDYLNMQFPE